MLGSPATRLLLSLRNPFLLTDTTSEALEAGRALLWGTPCCSATDSNRLLTAVASALPASASSALSVCASAQQFAEWSIITFSAFPDALSFSIRPVIWISRALISWRVLSSAITLYETARRCRVFDILYRWDLVDDILCRWCSWINFYYPRSRGKAIKRECSRNTSLVLNANRMDFPNFTACRFPRCVTVTNVWRI